MIPYGKHFLDEDDIQAVVDVLRNGALTQGPKVKEFEDVICDYTGSKYAVAVSSGTAALHLACAVSGVTGNDRVITTPNTFVASANSIFYVGGIPEFVDINPHTLNMDVNLLEGMLKSTKNIKGIIPVHFSGVPCEMDKIYELANKYNVFVIEDASHALGATYKDGSKVGNCRYSNMTVFSFHPVKGIASGEGGMITTNNHELYQKLLQLRSHGICKGNFDLPGISHLDNRLEKLDCAVENGELKMWYYEMQELGFNYRITDIQCALAISQMKKIDKFLERRKTLVSKYDAVFNESDIFETTQISERKNSSNHIYVLKMDFDRLGCSRHSLMKKLSAKGIGTQVHYIPIPMHPYYEKLGYSMDNLPECKKYYESALSIPLYYGLTDLEQGNVIKELMVQL